MERGRDKLSVVRRPPPMRAPRPLFHTLNIGTRLVHLFNPRSRNATALSFRTFGPSQRFDHQARRDGKQTDNPARGIYYADFTLASAIVELFGDVGVIECDALKVASPTVTRPLRLLDLRGQGAMRAGTTQGISSLPSRRLSQRWSMYFYETPIYQEADGLIFPNFQSGEDRVALYERAEDALNCPESDVMRLDSSALRAYLLEIADRYNLEFP